MLHKAIILSLGLLTLVNCNAQKETQTSNNTSTSDKAEIKETDKENGIIYLNEGERKLLKEYGVEVNFKGISEDSRCPKGVNCIWAGVAVADIELIGTRARPMTVKLATINDAGKNYYKSSKYTKYIVSLAEVTPFPDSEGGTQALKEKYRIGITIKEREEKSTTK